MTKKKSTKTEHVEQSSYHKPTQTFVISKRTKRMLALMPFANSQQRVDFKHAMIHAEIAEKEARNKPLKKEREDVSDRT